MKLVVAMLVAVGLTLMPAPAYSADPSPSSVRKPLEGGQVP
jgi:hypothetical protein